MEGLVLLLAELVFLLIAPLVSALFAIGAALLELCLVAFGGAAGSAVGGLSLTKGSGRVLRLIVHVSMTIAIVAVILALVIGTLFFERLVDFGLKRVEDKTGYAMTYDRVSGSLINGTFALEGLRVDRQSDTGFSAQIEIETVVVDVAITTVLSEVVEIEELRVSGVRGALAVPADPPDREKPRRAFMAEAAELRDIEITVSRGDGETVPVLIEQAVAAPFRSRAAPFDAFFRSNLTGSVGGAPVLIETSQTSDRGRATTWRIDSLPVDVLRAGTDRAPIGWLEGGTVSAVVDDAWSLDGTVDIDADWSVTLADVSLVAPEGAGLRERALVAGAASALRVGGDAPTINFSVDLDEVDWIDAEGEPDPERLVAAIVDGVRLSVARAAEDADEAPDAANTDEEGPGLSERLRGLFDRE